MAHYVVTVQVKRVGEPEQVRVTNDARSNVRPDPIDLASFVTKGKELAETITAAKGHLDLVTDF